MDEQVLLQAFPQLDSGFKITSPDDSFYNCIAWAARESQRWWWPEGGYWPQGVSRALTVASFLDAFGTLGYRRCKDGKNQLFFEKVVLYVNRTGEPTHMARQLIGGRWTSKLGESNDITHIEVEGVEGQAYGTALLYMRRPILRIALEKIQARFRQ